MTAAVAAIGCVITAGGLPIGQVTSSSGNIKIGTSTSMLQLSTALSAQAATVAFRVLFGDFPHFEAFPLPVPASVSHVFSLPRPQQTVDGGLITVESPVTPGW